MKIKFVIILLLLGFNTLKLHSQGRSITGLFEEAKYSELIDYYDENKDKFQSDPYIINKVGQAYHKLQNDKKALEYFNIAINLDPGESMYHSNRAMILITSNILDSAFISLDKALGLDSLNYHARMNKGYALIKQKKFKDAIPDLHIALNGFVDDEARAMTYGNLSTAYLNVQKNDLAFTYADSSISLNNKIPWVYKNRAFINITRNEINKALEDIEAGLELKPDERTLIYYKGLIFVKTELVTEGCELIKKSISLFDNINVEEYKIFYNSWIKYCN